MVINLRREKKVRNLIKKTLYNSSAQAIIKLVETPFISLKIFLSVCLIISSGLSSFLIIQLILDYLNYEVSTTSRTLYETPALFPQITVCNVNPFTTHYAAEFIKKINQDLYPDVDIFNEDQMKKLNFSMKNVFINKIKNFARYKMNSLNETEKKKLSHSLQDMMPSCYFNQKECLVNDFDWYFDPYYGNCWTFNSVQKLTSSFPGEFYGFRMDLYINYCDKLNTINSYSGGLGALIRIANSSYLTNFYPRDGIKLEPGQVTSISLRRSFKFSLPKPYSNCLIDNITNGAFKSELFDLIRESRYLYTQPTCFLLCLQRAILLKCNCIDPVLISLFSNATQCLTKVQTDCMSNLQSDVNDFVYEKCQTGCPLECYLQQFYESLSSYELMPKYYLDYLKAHSNLSDDFATSEIDLDSVRKSFVYFRIFYKVLSYEITTESPQTNLIWLFIGFASNLGILLGLNVFSLFEPIIVLIEICLMKFGKKMNETRSG
jgi:hypothetical protein